jgi:hypothetical protein
MADRPTPEQQMPVHVEAAYKDGKRCFQAAAFSAAGT